MLKEHRQGQQWLCLSWYKNPEKKESLCQFAGGVWAGRQRETTRCLYVQCSKCLTVKFRDQMMMYINTVRHRNRALFDTLPEISYTVTLVDCYIRYIFTIRVEKTVNVSFTPFCVLLIYFLIDRTVFRKIVYC